MPGWYVSEQEETALSQFQALPYLSKDSQQAEDRTQDDLQALVSF